MCNLLSRLKVHASNMGFSLNGSPSDGRVGLSLLSPAQTKQDGLQEGKGSELGRKKEKANNLRGRKVIKELHSLVKHSRQKSC